MARETYGFEPHGLPGWRVFKDPSAWAGSPENCWWFSRPADVPHSFSWSDETQSHSVPVLNDWAEGPRKTAKGAVAAAHAHAEWVKNYDAEAEAVRHGLRKPTNA